MASDCFYRREAEKQRVLRSVGACGIISRASDEMPQAL
jgi:hypothetical protein